MGTSLFCFSGASTWGVGPGGCAPIKQIEKPPHPRSLVWRTAGRRGKHNRTRPVASGLCSKEGSCHINCVTLNLSVQRNCAKIALLFDQLRVNEGNAFTTSIHNSHEIIKSMHTDILKYLKSQWHFKGKPCNSQKLNLLVSSEAMTFVSLG